MQHVFLSPHLDDAVLSCGGLIARLARQGHRVSVATVFTASGCPPFSPLAQHEHEHWGKRDDAYAARRSEDQAALARLGAEPVHLNLLEAIYRSDGPRAWRYQDVPSIFGARHPADEALVLEIASLIRQLGTGQTRWYVPSAIGSHVDHILVRDAALRMAEAAGACLLYADLPYALDQPGPADLETVFEPVEDQDVHAWIAAARCYRTQIPVLFQTDSRLSEAIENAATQPGTGGSGTGMRLYRAPTGSPLTAMRLVPERSGSAGG